MIEFVKKSIILFTDHDSTFDIVKQTSLLIIFTYKLNLRLVRAFKYIQWFNLIIKHKSNKQHIVLNALSRLDNENNELTSDSKILNALFITTLIEMNDECRNKIISEYFSNLKWKKIQDTLKRNSSIKLSFVIDNQFICRIDQIVIEHVYESRRLCISTNIVRNILYLAHFDNYHSKFVKCFDIVSSSWYIHELFKHFRDYLRYCSQCQIF
jgi:hypothetical protein